MPDEAPQVRSRHMQTFVEVIDRLPARDREAIRALVRVETLRSIAESASVGWLPAALNLEVTAAVAKHLGPAGAHRFFCDLLLAGFETPLLGSFVKGALRLAGNHPGLGLKWVPKGFALVFRNAGEWSTLEVTDTSATIVVTDMPEIMARDRVWLDSVASSLQALFELMKIPGKISVAEVELATRRVTFKAVWPR